MTWNVLLPGPSLADLKERPKGSIVSVNSAITHEIKPDIFCALDQPIAHQSYLEEIRGYKCWVMDRNRNSWEEAGFTDLVVFPWRAKLHASPDFGWLPRSPHRTVFYAIVGCLVHGATRIDLYGCDMGGIYFHGKGKESPKRWKPEATGIAKWTAAAKERGIVIERKGLREPEE